MQDFNKIEMMFSDLLKTTLESMSDAERAEIQSFIDVGEYGLALETAVDIHAEEAKPPAEAFLHQVELLAVAMSMDEREVLKRLNRPQKN